MKYKINLITAFVATILTGLGHAVNISSNGHGEVLLYPYYTVNNNMNTIYSVVNLTEQTKAIKVRFLEGEAGREVLEFNVYLSAYDVWTGVLGAVTSTISGHVGEPSALHLSSDNSCAPFLNQLGQEFVPYVIDIDAPNNNMIRVTDGHIEIIEMATFIGATAAAADHNGTGVPANCALITDFWGLGDIWSGDAEQLPTGGLSGSASIINVTEGLDFSYSALALEAFWQGLGNHSPPGSLNTNLGDASTESQILINDVIQVSEWATGIEAVSAILMQTEIYNEYDFDAAVLGRSEWVLNFPTKSHHVNNTFPPLQPFIYSWDGFSACHEFMIDIWDTESQRKPIGGGIAPMPPQGANPSFCYQTNVMEYISGDQPSGPTSSIFGADNLIVVTGVNSEISTHSGWAAVNLYGFSHSMTPISGSGYVGLPVLGFQVQKFTNNNAQPGLIAQYGRLFNHKSTLLNN